MNLLKNLRARRSAVKGFTLIELIVVMAIIAVLASMLSIAIIAYIRDAKMETADENAQIASKAIQKFLTEYEISGVELYDAKIIDPNDNTKTIKVFETSPGSKTIQKVFYVTTDKKETNLPKGADVYNAVTRQLPKDFEGAFIVQINDFTYSVVSVIYTDTKSSGYYDTEYLKSLAASNLSANGAIYLANHSAQENEYRASTRHCVGCYPYKSDIT